MQGVQISDPNLQSLLNVLKRDIFASLNCHRVGIIQSFNASNQTAMVELVDKRVLQAFNQPDQIQEYSPLLDVPVMIYGGNSGFVNIPIQKGDECIVLFNDRDIDAWFETGMVQKPISGRMHNFTDGVVICGLHSLQKSLSGYKADELGLFFKQAFISIDTSGQIVIKNGQASLKSILNDKILNDNNFLTALNTALQLPDFLSFSASIQPQIAGFISQNTVIDNFVNFLLKE